MSSIESFSLPGGSSVKSYAMLDTNQDEVVAPDELVAPIETADSETLSVDNDPTHSSADTLTDPVAAVLLDVHLSEDPASSLGGAIAAYHAGAETAPAG